MPELGRAALVVALGLLLYAAIGGAYAALRGRRRLLESARNALFASFAAVLVGAAVLLAALVRHDFSFVYVADHTSRELPLRYAAASFWGGQAGSLLLWLLVLTGMASAAVALNGRLTRDVLPWAVPIAAALASFFAFLLVFVASPFTTAPAPADGAGLNPSLQNPYMMAHPPLLYLGYVGLSIPFVFAMAALASRRTDERWIIATRRWTLASWTFLGFAILLGAKWAYEEVGWGGWYAWDPVENAALMPWLVATAFLHSVMVQEKKNMLRVWNSVLVAGAFALSLFGTFLTRSGVINSIHSFTQSSIGAWFIAFIAVVVAASTALIFVRLPILRSPTRLESLVSREAAFLYNNLFLVALALTVLWGVVYPLVSEAVRGVAVTVGAPYYDFFAIAFGLPIVLLMGVGPLVAWRRASGGRDRGRLADRRCRLEPGGADRLLVRRLRARRGRPRVHARDARAARACRRELVERIHGSRGQEPAALRRLRRPRGHRPPARRRRRYRWISEDGRCPPCAGQGDPRRRL
jgi:cytochrome c-type biogenesis protein CcmF